jgi:radical SAM/Cys-rich protein
MSKEPVQQESGQSSREPLYGAEHFNMMLSKQGLTLKRGKTHTLQINVGLICNQSCQHCHLDAGPGRKEIMKPDTIDHVVDYARRSHFETIDITGGAPELNPNIIDIVDRLSAFAPRMMFRSNLSVLNDGKRRDLIDLLKLHRVVIVASFPSLNSAQSDSQRGDGIYQVSIDALKMLNDLGYGYPESGLELNLVSNPAGAFLPPAQEQTEKRFRQVLGKKWGIVFNNLFNFANVPLGRFREWLIRSGNFEKYMEKLISSFNPCSVEGVMCRTLVSVCWDGYLYDCDFNIARGLYMGGRKIHVSEMEGPPEQEKQIVTADHCFTCTAGAGFT